MYQGSHEMNAVVGTNAADITDTTNTSIIAAKTGFRVNVTSLAVTNSHATVGTVVKIYSGSTLKARLFVAAAGGGYSLVYPVPLRGDMGAAWTAQAETTGAALQLQIAGFYASV